MHFSKKLFGNAETSIEQSSRTYFPITCFIPTSFETCVTHWDCKGWNMSFPKSSLFLKPVLHSKKQQHALCLIAFEFTTRRQISINRKSYRNHERAYIAMCTLLCFRDSVRYRWTYNPHSVILILNLRDDNARRSITRECSITLQPLLHGRIDVEPVDFR